MTERQYAAAGVDLESAEAAKERIGRLVAGTRTALSLGHVGAFGGMVRVPPGMRKPALVLSTDGVGTKVLVALEAGRFDTVGEDLVNHSVNDILVHARPPDRLHGLHRRVGAHGRTDRGNRGRNCPGLPRARNGAGRRRDGADAGTLSAGALRSGGHHHRRGRGRRGAARRQDPPRRSSCWRTRPPGFTPMGTRWPAGSSSTRSSFQLEIPCRKPARRVADALLAVHKSYFKAVFPVLQHIHGLAHITGGGIPGNLVRILPPGCEAVVQQRSWALPPCSGSCRTPERCRPPRCMDVFNLGVGMIAVLPPAR